MWRVSQFGLHTISHITGMLPDSFFAKDPSNQKWSFIDCKTASRTSCFSLGLCADPTPQSHCALPLLLPVNQSEPSVFVMVEDNQFQNKEKWYREDRLRGGGEEEKGRRKEALSGRK